MSLDSLCVGPWPDDSASPSLGLLAFCCLLLGGSVGNCTFRLGVIPHSGSRGRPGSSRCQHLGYHLLADGPRTGGSSALCFPPPQPRSGSPSLFTASGVPASNAGLEMRTGHRGVCLPSPAHPAGIGPSAPSKTAVPRGLQVLT